MQDDLSTGRSTFMIEMLETARILHLATPRSLIILDEIGRGTSTYDGLSIAQAVIEHIHNDPRASAKTIFATHYHELVKLADTFPRIVNYNVSVAEEDGKAVFLHKVVPGGADKSYGIHVAQLAGNPENRDRPGNSGAGTFGKRRKALAGYCPAERGLGAVADVLLLPSCRLLSRGKGTRRN